MQAALATADKAHGLISGRCSAQVAHSKGALAGRLNPIPFITEAAQSGMRHRVIEGYRSQFEAVDPFAIGAKSLVGSAVLSTRADALPLMPFVYMVEGAAGRWRLGLTVGVEGSGWLGRFMYPLPSTYDIEAWIPADGALVALLRQELVAGSNVLRTLMEREFRGELRGVRYARGIRQLLRGGRQSAGDGSGQAGSLCGCRAD